MVNSELNNRIYLNSERSLEETTLMNKMVLKQFLVLMVALTLSHSVLFAEVITGGEGDDGARFWRWSDQGVNIQLTQLTPLQSEAFFIGRGFSAKHAATIGNSCIFQGIFRNDGSHPIRYDLKKWQVMHQENRTHLLDRSYWDKVWRSAGVSESSRIAFRWSLLPTEQHFEPGDYNWGMVSFGLQPGEIFDLDLLMDINHHPVEGKISSIRCAQYASQEK